MATTATKTYQLYLNGQWQDAAGGKTFPVHNPATGELIAEVADGGAAEAEAAVQAAADAFPAWSKRPADERAELLHKTFDILKSRIEEHARILTEENGKPLAESRGEATISAGFVRWNAEEARRTYGEVVPSPTAAKRVLTFRQPVGVVAAITPWNFPLLDDHAQDRPGAGGRAAPSSCARRPRRRWSRWRSSRRSRRRASRRASSTSSRASRPKRSQGAGGERPRPQDHLHRQHRGRQGTDGAGGGDGQEGLARTGRPRADARSSTTRTSSRRRRARSPRASATPGRPASARTASTSSARSSRRSRSASPNWRRG